MLRLEPSLRQCAPYKQHPPRPSPHSFNPTFLLDFMGKFPEERCSPWNRFDWECWTDRKTKSNSNTFDQADVDPKANEKREGLSAHRLRGGRVIESRAHVCAYPLPGGLIADVFVSVARRSGPPRTKSAECPWNPTLAARRERLSPDLRLDFFTRRGVTLGGPRLARESAETDTEQRQTRRRRFKKKNLHEEIKAQCFFFLFAFFSPP